MDLMTQARCGNLDVVKTLIQQGVSVNSRNKTNQTALFHACEHGQTEVAQYLIDNGASVNLGAKPLIAAVRHDHYDCVKLLLQHHAYVNCTNTKRESPMSLALQKHHYSIILLLLQYQYDVNPSASLSDIASQLLKYAKAEHAKIIQKLIDKNIIKLTSENLLQASFSFAFKHGSDELADSLLSKESYPKLAQLYSDAVYYSAKNNWPFILSKLLEERVNINVLTDGQTPLYVACKEGYETVVTLLLNNGADPHMPNKLTPASDDIPLPLHIAVQRGNVTIVKLLLEKGAKLDQASEPLLHIACSGANELKTYEATETGSVPVEHVISIVRVLLQQGVNVNAISNKGDTALHRACTSQQLEVVQMLLEAGADVNLTSNRCYPLIAACSAGNIELIHLLVKAGPDVKCSSRNNATCLHAAIDGYLHQKPADSSSKSNIEVVIKSLLEVGVDVNASCSQEETALYRASKAGHEGIVQLLLEAGAETDGSSARRPLYVACDHGYTQIVDLLLQHGADANASSTFLTRTEIQTSMLSSLLAKHAACSSSLPLCCAAKKGYTDIIHLLLKHGADANKQDQFGKSALIHFTEMMVSQKCNARHVLSPLQETNCDILKSMLVAGGGGDVNTCSGSNGQNALHIASSFGMCDLMMELIQHGANCNHPTSSGKTALDLAFKEGHEATMELLLKNGAKPDGRNAGPATRGSGSIRVSYDSYQSSMSILCRAVENGSDTMVKMLLHYGSNVNACGDKGNSALHLATSHAVFEMLLKAGANVNATNDKGETALSLVCEKQHADATVIELLLKFGADPNICFPLHFACKNNNPDVVRLLLSYDADANLAKESFSVSERFTMWTIVSPKFVKTVEPSPLCIACKHGNVAIVDNLLKHGATTEFADSGGNTPLHNAVEGLGHPANSEQYDPIVTLLLQHNAPVNVVSNKGETPLYAACTKGCVSVVKQLLDCRADASLTTHQWKKYPLLIACEKKIGDVAMMLLDRGADADVSNDDKQTPLKLASANGDAALVKELLSRGADVNQMQNVSDTALHVAVRCKGLGNKAFVHMVQRLLKSCANSNALNAKGETPLYLACRPNDDNVVNIDVVQMLLKHGADPNICPPGVDLSPWSRSTVLSLLSAASVSGNTELVKLLTKFGAKIEHRDAFGRTALHIAVGGDDIYMGDMYRYMDYREHSRLSKTNTAIVEMLLSAGADANAVDKTGASPLYLACKRGKTEFVKLLLSHGVDPNSTAVDKCPIHAACKGQHYDSVKLLLEYNADVAIGDKTGKTALHHALESESHNRSDGDRRTELVQLLLARGANVNTTSETEETPFYIACSKGLASIVEKMLESGAKINENRCGKLPLHVACKNKHVSIVQMLLINGANPTIPGHYSYYYTLPLHMAAASNNSELAELLLKHGANIDAADTKGNTALHVAVQRYYPTATREQYASDGQATKQVKSTLDILLENKADVNIINSCGQTPLYTSASRDLPDVVRQMLQTYGANPNRFSQNKCPLLVACERRNVKLVDTLLKHGADPNLASSSCGTDSDCRLPLSVAAEQDNCDEIIKLLIKAGANVNATDHKGKSALCTAAEHMTNSLNRYHHRYAEQTTKQLATIRLLLEHGANTNVLLPDGHSLLHFVITAIEKLHRRGEQNRTHAVELLKLMVEHGSILSDSFSDPEEDIYRQSLSGGVLRALATFDSKHEFVVDLFQAGAGFQLLALCCNAVTTNQQKATSILLSQAASLAGYTPGAEELHNLQVAAAGEGGVSSGLLGQLVNWLHEDRQQAPSLLRQCRVAIRRQLSVAVRFQTIIPSIDKLPLPNDMKLYLKFKGTMTEVDLSVNMELQTSETIQETSVENRRQLLSPYEYDYYDVSYFEDDYYRYSANSSDNDSDEYEPYWSLWR